MMDSRALPELQELLPHRGPMLLLDRVVSYQDDIITCAKTVDENSSFCEPGVGVPTWVAIEYLAQSAAVLGGIRAWQNQRRAPQGMLLGSRKLESQWRAFPVGSELQIQCQQTFADPSGMTAYRGDIIVADECIVTATFNIYLQLEGSEQT